MTRITNTILSPSIPNPQYKRYLNGRLTLTLITLTALAVAYHGIITPILELSGPRGSSNDSLLNIHEVLHSHDSEQTTDLNNTGSRIQ